MENIIRDSMRDVNICNNSKWPIGNFNPATGNDGLGKTDSRDFKIGERVCVKKYLYSGLYGSEYKKYIGRYVESRIHEERQQHYINIEEPGKSGWYEYRSIGQVPDVASPTLMKHIYKNKVGNKYLGDWASHQGFGGTRRKRRKRVQRTRRNKRNKK